MNILGHLLSNEKKYTNKDFFYLLVITFPIFIYLSFVYHFALNIPHMDDFDAILDFIVNCKKGSFSEKIILLFGQHNEHRILSSRIIYALYYHIFGTVNFRHIILLNAFVLISLFLFIARFIKISIPQHWRIATVVLSFCMFDLNNYDNADFAMAGLQNYGVILLFVASIFFYSRKDNKYLVPAVLLQILCVFSSGNGNVAAFFILMFVIISRVRIKTIAALTTFLVISPLYYLHYTQPPTNFFTLDPTKFIPFFLHAIAAHFTYEGGVSIGVLLVTLILVTLPFGRKFVIKNNSLPLICLAAFILASMGVMSIFRGNLPITVSYASRYFVYSHLIVALLFVFIIINLQDKKVLLPVKWIAILLTLFVYKNNMQYGKDGFNEYYTVSKTTDFDFPDKIRAKQVSDEACQLNIYCIDKHRADR